jgi:hypothetical protein
VLPNNAPTLPAGTHQIHLQGSNQLRRIFHIAIYDLRDIKHRIGGTWREAAYTRAVDSVLEAEKLRSNVSR